MVSAATLPTWFGRAALVAFFVMQLFDGMLTYKGILAFGPAVEANPIVATYVAVLGTGAAMIAVKCFASACAVLLYFHARHREVAVLALLYGMLAVGPWVLLLQSASL